MQTQVNEQDFITVPQAVSFEMLGIPHLMGIPTNIDVNKVVPNNQWMKDEIKYNKPGLLKQWGQVNRELAMDGPVFTMVDSPLNKNNPNQDLIYAANAGIALKGKDGVTKFVVSRFCSEPRRGETAVIAAFVENIFGKENVIVPPETFEGEVLYFEGEADLKAIHHNVEEKRADVYIMGVGVRSNEVAAKWFEANFDIRVIPYAIPDDIKEDLYHLDCVVFPIDKFSTIMLTDGIDEKTLEEVEEYTEIIPVEDDDVDMLFNGLTNSIRLKNRVYMPYDPTYSENMSELELEEFQELEDIKIAWMSDVCNDCGLQLITTEVCEGYAGGAQLSCFTCSLVDQYYKYYENGI